jgi:hypothetical protein
VAPGPSAVSPESSGETFWRLSCRSARPDGVVFDSDDFMRPDDFRAEWRRHSGVMLRRSDAIEVLSTWYRRALDRLCARVDASALESCPKGFSLVGRARFTYGERQFTGCYTTAYQSMREVLSDREEGSVFEGCRAFRVGYDKDGQLTVVARNPESPEDHVTLTVRGIPRFLAARWRALESRDPLSPQDSYEAIFDSGCALLGARPSPETYAEHEGQAPEELGGHPTRRPRR